MSSTSQISNGTIKFLYYNPIFAIIFTYLVFGLITSEMWRDNKGDAKERIKNFLLWPYYTTKRIFIFLEKTVNEEMEKQKKENYYPPLR